MLVAEGAGLTLMVSGLEVSIPKWAMKVAGPPVRTTGLEQVAVMSRMQATVTGPVKVIWPDGVVVPVVATWAVSVMGWKAWPGLGAAVRVTEYGLVGVTGVTTWMIVLEVAAAWLLSPAKVAWMG